MPFTRLTITAPRRLALAVLAAGLAAWGYLAWLSNVVAFDDAFISFRYAHNLVAGHGLVFNPGERVEGYTNFLWTLMAAAGIGLGWDPMTVTRALGVAAYLTAIALGVMAVGARIGRAREFAALALCGLLVLPPTFPAFAGTGLETSFVGLLVLLTGLGQLLWDRDRAATRWLAGLAPLLAALPRLDAVIALAASALVMVVAERRSWAGLWRRLLPALLPTAVGVGLHLGWRLHYYGEFLPNTYYAKAADLVSFGLGVEYLFGFVWSCPASLVLLGLTWFAARKAGDGRVRAFASYVGIACLAQTLFLAKVGGDFMEYRLCWEYWPLLVVGGTLGAVELLRRWWLMPALGIAATLALGRVPVVIEQQHHMQSVREMDNIGQRTRRVGTVLAAVLPADSTIATTAAGMAYFAPGLRVVDQLGLNDYTVARMPVPQILSRGHVKQASPAYLAARRVNLEFRHPQLSKCSNPRQQNRAQVFIRLGADDTCVRSFYLTPTPELSRHFCNHPEWFVLQQIPCPLPD